MRVACRASRYALASADDLGIVKVSTSRHVTTCLQCQAEAARFRRLGRALAALADHHDPAPEGLAEVVAQRVADPGSVPSAANELAASPSTATKAAAVAGTVAAAVGAALVLRMLRARTVT